MIKTNGLVVFQDKYLLLSILRACLHRMPKWLKIMIVLLLQFIRRPKPCKLVSMDYGPIPIYLKTYWYL